MAKAVTRMTIEDAEHISQEEREQIIASYPPHERDARVKGIPSMGSGRVFPVAEDVIAMQAFEIPDYWARIAGIDFGWDHPTAAVEFAHDRDADVIYLTKAYRAREKTPLEHATVLHQWGEWLPWAWPADAYQRDKRTGGTLRDDYRRYRMNMLGAHATFPDGGNGVEPGVQDLLMRMQSGRFKVFSHLEDWFSEFRMYHRKDGIIVKERDDLMDATRYALMMLRFAEPPYLYSQEAEDARYQPGNEVTGY